MAVTSLLSIDPGLQAWAHLSKAGLNKAEAEMNYLLKSLEITAAMKRQT